MIVVRRLLLLLLVMMGIVYWFQSYLLPPLADWLDSSEPYLPVEYVAVLPGGNETRTFAAAALVRERLADKVIILRNIDSGDVTAGHGIATHQVTRRILLRRGVRSDQILELEGKSTTTMSDAKILAQIWDLEPEARVGVVTTSNHMRRARWTMEHVLPDHAEDMTFISCPNDAFERESWWMSRAGAQAILTEYIKLAAYAFLWADNAERIGAVAVVFIMLFLLFRALSPYQESDRSAPGRFRLWRARES